MSHARGHQRGDLLQRGVDVGGLRRGHRLDADGGVAADLRRIRRGAAATSGAGQHRAASLRVVRTRVRSVAEDVEHDRAGPSARPARRGSAAATWPKHGLARRDRDRVRGRRRAASPSRARGRSRARALLEVLRADARGRRARSRRLVRAPASVMCAPEVGQRAVLPLVDQQGAGGVGAERDARAVRHAGVLDGALQLVGEVEVGVPLRRGDRRPSVVVDFTRVPPVVRPAVRRPGSSNVNGDYRWPGSLSALDPCRRAPRPRNGRSPARCRCRRRRAGAGVSTR